MRGKQILETDYGRIRVSRSVQKTTVVVENEVGDRYIRQVLRGNQIDRFREQVNLACDTVLRDQVGVPEKNAS